MSEPQVDFDSPDQNQLAVIVEESKLPQSKGKYILEKFQDYFTMADEWTKTTQQIKVTDASQTHLMDMARAARLAIREKRLAVEKAHKEIKADVLREGRAIDGIKNVLLALLEPLENYYADQECFVERQAAAKAKLIEQEIQERLDREFEEEQAKKRAEELRIREENEALKEKAYAVELERRKEREEQEKKDAVIRIEQERKIAEIQRANEALRKQERLEREKVEAELRAKKEAEAKLERERIAKEEALKKAGDREKLLEVLENIKAIHLPINLKSKESHIAVTSVQNLLEQAEDILRSATEHTGVDL